MSKQLCMFLITNAILITVNEVRQEKSFAILPIFNEPLHERFDEFSVEQWLSQVLSIQMKQNCIAKFYIHLDEI